MSYWVSAAAMCVGGLGTIVWFGPEYVVGRVLQAWAWMSAVCEQVRGPPPPTWVGLDAEQSVSTTHNKNDTHDWRVCYREWRVNGHPVYTRPDVPCLPPRVALPTLSLIITHDGRSVDFQRDLSAYAYEGNACSASTVLGGWCVTTILVSTSGN